MDAHHVTSFSHGIRTPLSIIILSVELLKNYGHQCSEDQRHAYLHQIHLAARQMSQTLNGILTQFDQDFES
ncbi:histidine kinase dimerization/phospho-acceptor domain-containing protein [Trichothermofontia sp.]